MRDSNGDIRNNIRISPSLLDLRKLSREIGTPLDRLDIWDTDFQCASCNSIISDRFGANQAGDLLCWDCATNSDSED
ncbi:MAG: hypothetical protein ABEI86_04840, partial [Halobacteriaceae archaeon]